MKDSDMFGLAALISGVGFLVVMDAKFGLGFLLLYFVFMLVKALRKEDREADAS
jgi:hypothetical protein